MKNLYAGIIKFKDSKVKMLYTKKDNVITDVKNFATYRINEETFIELEVPLNDIIESLNLENKTPEEIYEILLDNPIFLHKNCNYFGIRKMETGYKYITRYVRMFDEEFESKTFYDLEEIIKTPKTIQTKNPIKRFVRTRFRKKDNN